MFKKFLIIIFFGLLLPFYLLSAHQQLQENRPTQFLSNNNSSQGEIRKIWQRIPRWEEISSKIRDFWNFTILPKLSKFQNGFGQRIEIFFKEKYEKRKLIIQEEIQKEKQELIELTPPIIIKTWERIIIIKEFIINVKEIIKNFLKQEEQDASHQNLAVCLLEPLTKRGYLTYFFRMR